MNIIRKDASITNTDDAFPGTFEVILSSPTKDRDGDTLLPDEWKMPLPEKITFDSDHGMSVATTVGSGTPSINEKGQLIVSGTYSSLDRAQEVRTLVNEGHINKTSVAFMTVPNETKGAKKGAKLRELLNGAFVAIPANREADVLLSKGIKSGARNSATDTTLIQSIHDHAAELGAGCADATKSAKSVEFKSVVGSLEATQDRARDALQDFYPNVWVYIRATIPDGAGGGTLVFDLENTDTYDSESYKQDYLDDGSVITLTGERSPVDLMEIIKPDPDETAESAAEVTTAAAEKSAAAAETKTADEVQSEEMQTRSARLRMFETIANASRKD
jgi:hypothetical protein